MKKNFLIAYFMLMVVLPAFTQTRMTYDMEYLLNNVPELKTAQIKIDQISIAWQNTLENKYAKIRRLYRSLEYNAATMSSKKKKEIESKIAIQEKEVLKLREHWFGAKGELFKKRDELLKPLQDKIYSVFKQTNERKG